MVCLESGIGRCLWGLGYPAWKPLTSGGLLLKVDAWQWTRDERTENYLFLSTLAPEDPFSGIMNFHRITRLYVLRDCRTLYFLDELSPDGNYFTSRSDELSLDYKARNFIH